MKVKFAEFDGSGGMEGRVARLENDVSETTIAVTVNKDDRSPR